MNLKFIIIKMLFFILITTSLPIYALSNLEKLSIDLHTRGFPRHVNPELFKKILEACKQDKQSNQKASQKETYICSKIETSEKFAYYSYINYIKSCSYRKLSNSAKLDPNFYNQYFFHYLLKRNAIYLANSQNPNELERLERYKDACMNELKKRLLPSFVKECKKENPYRVYYSELLSKINIFPK